MGWQTKPKIVGGPSLGLEELGCNPETSFWGGVLEGKKDPFVLFQSTEKEVEVLTDLPAGFIWESSNLHAVRSASRAGSSALVGAERARISIARPSGELDRQALAHEVGSIFCVKVLARRTGIRFISRRAELSVEGP